MTNTPKEKLNKEEVYSPVKPKVQRSNYDRVKESLVYSDKEEKNVPESKPDVQSNTGDVIEIDSVIEAEVSLPDISFLFNKPSDQSSTKPSAVFSIGR